MTEADVMSDSEKRKLNKYYVEGSLMYARQDEEDLDEEVKTLLPMLTDLFDAVILQSGEKTDAALKIVKILKQTSDRSIREMSDTVFSRYQGENLDKARLVWLKLVQRCATVEQTCNTEGCPENMACQHALKTHIDKIRNDGALSLLKDDVMQAMVSVARPEP